VRKVLVDTGPLVAALDAQDSAHPIAVLALGRLRRQALVPTPVLAEVDHFVRSRVGGAAARTFLKSVVGGVFEISYLSAGILRRAGELDRRYADLDLGFADTCTMALAERHDLPIFTFDFGDFRATESASGPWDLVLDEHAYRTAVAR
jgi:predicted nucleic acid-binding protein